MRRWKIAGVVVAAGILTVGCSNRARTDDGTGGSGADPTAPERRPPEDLPSRPGSEMPAEPDTLPQGTSTPGDLLPGTGGAGPGEPGADPEAPPTLDDETMNTDPLEPEADAPMDPATPAEGSSN